MNGPLRVQAVVSAAEHAALASALARLGAALAVPIALEPRESFAGVFDAPSLVITTLFLEADSFTMPWTETEQRLRAAYANLCQNTQLTVCVCTVFRHVTPDAQAPARLRHIRRLNLLAAEMSQELGLTVIDLDRALADIGARALATDHRLGGPYATEMAAKCIALALLVAGLDAYASFAAQDAARAAISAYQPPCADVSAAVGLPVRWDLVDVGTGRQRQRVSVVIDNIVENQVGALLRMVLRRQMSPMEAAAKLVRAVGHRGLRSSAALLTTALMRMVRHRLRTAR